MAEDIVQRLGFDAGGAIGTIRELSTALKTLNDAFKGVGTDVKAYNTQAKDATKSFEQISKAAQTAVKALQQVADVQKQIASQPAIITGGGGGGADPTALNAQLANVQQITRAWGEVPSRASAATKQAYQAAQLGLAQFAAQNKVTTSQMAAAFSGNAAEAGRAANGLITRVKALGEAHTRMTNEATQNAQQFTASWQTMLRILSTRVFLSVLSQIKTAIREGLDVAVEFGIRLQEIGTISQGTTQRIAGFREELIKISTLTGQDLTAVAEGFYQTLSNQVGDAGQSLRVFEAAANLALVTNSSLADSVNLLTATLNGAQLGAEQAEEAAGVLFKTIELGRFRVGDLADVMGRVLPLATQLGVGLEEVNADLAVMTTQGTRAHTAITQLRAVMSQMLKPTKELQKLFREEFGVENAQEAVDAFGGLVPLMVELDKVAGDNVGQMAELFTNVRALTGVLGTTTGIEKLKDDFAELSEAGQANIEWARQLVAESPAKQAQLAFNELKISVEEFGNALIPTATIAAKLVTGLADEVATLTVAAAALVAIRFYPAMVQWATGLKAATLGAQSLAFALDFIAPAAAAVLAFKLGQYFSDWAARAEEAAKATRELREETVKAASIRRASLTRVITTVEKAAVASVGKFVAEQNKAYFEQVAVAKRANTATTKFAKQQLGDLLSTQESIVKALEEASTKAAATIQKSNERSTDIRRGLEQKYFDWTVENLDDVTKSWRRANRAQELIAQGQRLLSRAGLTPEQIARAEDLIKAGQQQAEQASQEASSIADIQQRRTSLFRTRQAEVSATASLLQLEERRRQLAKESAAKAEAELQDQLKLTRDVGELVEDINRGISQFDGAKPKSSEQLAKDFASAQASFAELQKKLRSKTALKLVSISDLLGVSDLGRQLQQQAGKLPKLKATLEADYDELRQRLEAQSRAVPLEIQLNLTAAGIPFDPTGGPGQITQGLGQLQKDTQELRTQLAQIKDEEQRIAEAIAIVNTVREQGNVALGDASTTQGKILQRYNQITQAIGEIDPSKLVIGSEEFTRFQNYAQAIFDIKKELRALTTFQTSDIISFRDANARVTLLADQLDTVRTSTGKLFDLDGAKLQENLDAKTEALTRIIIATEQWKQSLERAGEAAKNINPPQLDGATNATDQMKKDSAAIKDNMVTAANAAIEAARQIALLRPSGGLTASKGGTAYLAKGGQPFGTDTIPAMLTKGERVTNAAATRRFYSQLVAMDAGVEPVYRSDGGSVTNVGDINITMQGGESTHQSARNIVTAVRRELRRGSSRLG
jgi:TP901 family phage tail tape measure protein